MVYKLFQYSKIWQVQNNALMEFLSFPHCHRHGAAQFYEDEVAKDGFH